MTASKVRRERRGWAVLTAVAILKPALFAFTKRDWIDIDKIPATGGCVVVFNHVSHLDPFTSAHLVNDAGRTPRYLAKSGLFTNKALGGFLRSAGQIPVSRMTSEAAGAYEAAVQGIRDGKAIIVYPEGTLTRDPDGWPMRGKSGAARIALATGCPVIPVGQWGVQEILPAYTKKPHLLPRKTVHLKVGDPVDLEDLLVREPTLAVVHEATDRIMAAITGLVEDLRHEHAPALRFDPRASGVTEVGNPHRKKKDGS
ncbi:lysophospholipid acyltransferase family protein [Nocardioides sp.]|uniref:lysophospholipid acyltransferase family protein n=1 Tax=Nocardioides sp. TaxID=35761 RepID=UPI003D0ED9B7